MKYALLAGWVLLVGLVIAAIMLQDALFTSEVQPIAVLEKRSGGAVTRNEGVIRWHDLVVKDGILDGDMVATGEDGRVQIRLGPGRTLTLQEDTQVKITAIQTAGQDRSFLIKLIKGAASAQIESECKTCGEVIFRAGDETVRVLAGRAVGLIKDAGQKPIRRFQPGKNDFAKAGELRPKSSSLISSNFLAREAPPPVVKAPVVVKAPPPPPPAPPPPVAPALPPLTAAMEAEVAAPAAGLEYWTMDSVQSLKSEALDFAFTPPTQHPERGELRPHFELSGSGGAEVDLPAPAAGATTVRIPVDKALAVAAVSQHGGIKIYSFGLRGGAELSLGKDKAKSFAKKAVPARIYSLGEVPDGPVSIGLSAFNATSIPTGSPWLKPKDELSIESAPFAIHLPSKADYPKFIPYLRSSAQVAISRQGPGNRPGIFVVRRQEVVAELSGSMVDKALMDKVLKLLQADFVYKGLRSSLRSSSGASKAALADSIGALLDKGEVLYILKRNKIYPVNRDFVKTSNEVAEFIDTQAMAIFLQSVDILASR